MTLNGRLMDLYMRKYSVKHEVFAPYALNAHANAMHAPHALLKKPLTIDDYDTSKVIASPIQVCMLECGAVQTSYV